MPNSATSPETRVITFLDALQAMDADALRPQVGQDIVWRNTGLPAVRGKKWVERILIAAAKILTEYTVVDVSELYSRGETVYSRRREILRSGRVSVHLTVDSTFVFRERELVVWDDRFSFLDLFRGIRIGGPE